MTCAAAQRLHVRRAGPAGRSPAVLLHSLGGDGTQWQAVAGLLAQAGVPSLAPDLPGHGLSPPVNEGDTAERHADAVVATLEQLGDPPPALLVGLSFGGLLALSIARRHPRHVPRLALLATGARIGVRQQWEERSAAVQRDGLAALAAPIVQRWFSPAFAAAHPSAVAKARAGLAASPVAGYCAACRVLAATDLTDELPRITMPALVLAGGADPVTPPGGMRTLAASLPRATYVELPGAGHLPHVEAPDRVASLLLDFLTVPTS